VQRSDSLIGVCRSRGLEKNSEPFPIMMMREEMDAAGGSGISEMVFLGEKEHGRRIGGMGRDEHYW